MYESLMLFSSSIGALTKGTLSRPDSVAHLLCQILLIQTLASWHNASD